MKVLFAVSNENTSQAIIKKYQAEYKKIISYKNVYYFNAILKEFGVDADGTITNDINTNHYSMEHFNWEPDKQWWLEQLEWIFEDPSPETLYPRSYQFLLDLRKF